MVSSQPTWPTRVLALVQDQAHSDLRGLRYTTHLDDQDVVLTVYGEADKQVRLLLRGDVVEIVYNQRFSYLTFMTDVEEEIEETLTECLSEIVRICSGEAQFAQSKTAFMRKPVLLLRTSTNEIWPFYER